MSGALLWAGVALLSGAGALTRFLADGAVSRRVAGRFPWGTVVVNLSGALVLGIVAGAGTAHGTSLLLGTALIGSYTTFSTWMLETLLLAEDGRSRGALANLAGQTAAGLVVAALGWAIGAAL